MTELLGQLAPDFTLPSQDGTPYTLSDFRGQWVLLYFYPKDMTPGCTVEACSFRDRLGEFERQGVQVLGISADSVASHQKFSAKERLNFPILADEDKTVVNAYGLWVEKSMYGKKFMGIQRDSFLIDPEGKIVRHYVKVKPEEHIEEILADVQELAV